MRWTTNRQKKAGGVWRCAVKIREAHARYDTTPNRREARHRFEISPARQLYKQLHDLGRVRVRY